MISIINFNLWVQSHSQTIVRRRNLELDYLKLRDKFDLFKTIRDYRNIMNEYLKSL